jgi:hypothetical protein
MKEECDKEFGVDSIILTKPIFNQKQYIPYKVSSPIRILYTGSLVIGRDKTIVTLANAIKEVNKSGQKIILDVYTNTKLTEKQRNSISIPGCCVLHDAIPQTKALELQKEADILLFVEALSDKNLTARLSFSTKLTDYFSAGKCIWAIGNKDLGPIAYLKDEDAGLVSTSSATLKITLNEIIERPTKIEEYAKKSFNCGKRNHDGSKILNKLSKEIIDY